MIPVKNIYYMLSYAFKILNEGCYKSVATESFENASDLFAAILIKGVTSLLSRGLSRSYIGVQNSILSVKGKINLSATIKENALIKREVVCEYDEFSPNEYQNKILKSTMILLLKADVSLERKKKLRKLLCFFREIDEIDVYKINWDLKFNRNNLHYRMLLGICQLVVKGLLQTQSDGCMKLRDYLDEQRMSRLYEKFVLEFYRREYPGLKVSASEIQWALDDDFDDRLPTMKTDIMLQLDESVLIIDTKWYSSVTQSKFDSHTWHSANMYQIFTYVKNKESELQGRPHQVSGMLLYAKTDEQIQPNHVYMMSGNKISVKSLDLNVDFSQIKASLDDIAREFIRG